MTTRVMLPLFTYPDASPEAGLQRALALAATLEASVTALVHEARISPITEPLAQVVIDVAGMAKAAEELSRSRGVQLAKVVEAAAAELALPLTIKTLRAERLASEAIASAARTFDFTFVAGLADSPDHALMIEDILFWSGGPVVLFPATPGTVELQTVAVAWDGSRAASRALRDAVPILKRARQVVLVSASDDKAIPSGAVADATAFMAAHGIDAKAVSALRGTDAISDVLQKAALDEGAELLVMGAYGHSRLREFVLGGATKSVLAAPKLAVLMSH